MRADWVECTFDDLIENISTSNYKIKQKDYTSNGEIPVVDQGQNLIGGYFDNKENIIPVELPVVVFGDHTKCVKYINFQFVPGADGTKVLKIDNNISTKYIYYLLKVLVYKIEDKGYARHFQYLQKELIPLPPLPEQRAIVKKIEALFSSLDAGIADLKKAQDQLKIYRQAVLKKAFEGELTNIKNFKIISIKEVVELNPKLDKTTISSDLVCQFVPMKLVEEKINKIHLIESKPFNELQGKSYTYFANDDLIFAKVTPCMENGKIAVAKDLHNNIAFGSSEFHVLRPSEKILSNYLFHFFVRDKFRIEAERNMTGAVGLRRVPKKFIEDYLIPLPSLEEQAQIVKEIESRLSVCDAVEQQIKDSLNQSEALRQSILKKAFEGRLLSDEEIKACQQEPDYEPASVLLKKIKAEKEANKPVKKTKKK